MASEPTGPDPEWVELDVTSYVDAEASGDGVITFCLTTDHAGWQRFYSRESATPPELVVQW